MVKLNIEIADNAASLAQGLMHRQTLDANSGMLFKFPYITDARFWGKNTYIPLDIAFIDRENRITTIKQITPMSTRMVSANALSLMAIEVNAGFFEKNGIKVGDTVKIYDHYVEFLSC